MPYGLTLIQSQLFARIPFPTSDFAGHTIIVTGSNTGLGLEAVRHLVRLGAKVILGVRTLSKGEAAAADIRRSCDAPADRVAVWQLDMSDHDSIKAFAKSAATLERLDAAILNAGVLSMSWSEINGVESHIAINVIGTVLLELLLLPILQRSARSTGQRGRMTIVGSDMMYMAQPEDLQTSGSILDKLNTKGEIDIGSYYRLSKLLVFYATRRIAQEHLVNEKSNVVITVMTPGACVSDIFRDDMPMSQRIGMIIGMKLLARTTEVGGRTLVDAVKPETGAAAHGKFLMDCCVTEQVPFGRPDDTESVTNKPSEIVTVFLVTLVTRSRRSGRKNSTSI